MSIVYFENAKVEQLSKKYGLAKDQVIDLYMRTLDDFVLLERACQRLAAGEEKEEVYLFIVEKRK